MKKIIFLLLLSFMGCPYAFTQEVPKPYGWVNDFAEVIDYDYRDKINALIQEVERKTTAEIVVVTKESIAPYDEAEYARAIFDSWKPGKKNKDNGVLVLLAVKERRWRIEVGYGLEGILPDSLCGTIGRAQMVPYFKEGKYSQGLYFGVAAIAEKIAEDSRIKIESLSGIKLNKLEEQKTAPPFLYFFVFVFFFIWNLPWPFFIGLPFSLLFGIVFYQISPLLTLTLIAGYVCSLIFRYIYWSKLPPYERNSYFGPQGYGSSSGGHSGGFGGFGGGGGGFGGGGGGGGGAGGGF